MSAVDDAVAAQVLGYAETVVGAQELIASAWSALHFRPYGPESTAAGYFIRRDEPFVLPTRNSFMNFGANFRN